MNYFSSKNPSLSSLNPLKLLIISHIAVCIASALFTPFMGFWNLPSITSVLALSSWGLKHHFFWQPITHILASPFEQVNISLIFYLVFNMYFLWSIGQALIQIKGVKDFLILYFGGALASGLCVTYYLLSTHSPMIAAGITPAMYALLTAWMLLAPQMQILLFFTIPVRVKWLILGIIGAHLFIDLSNGQFANFIYYFSSIFFAYIYCILCWNINSPFPLLHPLENILHRFFNSTKKLFKKSPSKGAHIYDFKTGSIIQTEKPTPRSFIEKWKLKKSSKKFKRKEDL